MKKYTFLLSVLFLITAYSCEKRPEKDIADKDAKIFIDMVFDEYYYWYDLRTPASVFDNDIYQFFETSLYHKDRWSWMTDGKSWNESETGEYVSYGGSIMQPLEYFGDYDLKIAYVFPDSPFSRAGVARGWTLTHLNGVPVMDLILAGKFEKEYANVSNRFRFLDLNGQVRDLSLTAERISTRSYLKRDVFTSADYPGLGAPVAYFNYYTFNQNMLDDIGSTFRDFHDRGVKHLIVDLRYNSGGSMTALEKLSNYMAPKQADGGVLLKMKHNTKKQALDSKNVMKIKREIEALNLEQVFFLTGHHTASASEALINGLKPYFDPAAIHVVGDTTYGKPNGMYVFPYPQARREEADPYRNAEYVFLPICFYNVNKDDEGDYDNGIIPDHYRPDDLYSDWGVQEDLTGACLHYIVHRKFPPLPGRKMKKTSAEKGIRLSDETDRPGYGRLYLLP